MGSRPPNFYKLTKGAAFHDLFPMDFMDVMWQAFERDKFESITFELSKPTARIRMRVVDIVKKKAKPP
jgi:hypothetical protein